MGLLDYYRRFEAMTEREISERLRATADERRRKALSTIPPLDLSATTWHEPPHPDVVNAVTFAARRALHAEPDAHAVRLRRALGERHALEPERVAVGSGAGELLATAVRTLLGPGDELVMPWPSYPLAALVARGAGARAVPVEEPGADAIVAAVGRATRMIVLCNPNDPDGAFLSAEALRGLLERTPEHVTVIVDEALRDFVDAEPVDATLTLLDDFPRLLLVRTFAKAWALGGLRCGYALGEPELLNRIAAPLGISVLAQEGATEALQVSGPQVERRRTAVAQARTELAAALRDLGYDVADSQANVLWARAAAAGSALHAELERHGVITHPGSALGDPDHVRITVRPDAPAAERLLRAARLAAGQS